MVDRELVISEQIKLYRFFSHHTWEMHRPGSLDDGNVSFSHPLLNIYSVFLHSKSNINLLYLSQTSTSPILKMKLATFALLITGAAAFTSAPLNKAVSISWIIHMMTPATNNY